MSTIFEYAERQRQVYDNNATDRMAAEGLVGPNYHVLGEEAHFQAEFIVNEYLRRQPAGFGEDIDFEVPILDFGCGVGRVMRAVRSFGFVSVDGVDISERMIQHAAVDQMLSDSRFWVSGGMDLGDAPKDHYGLVYSTICMNHISMRHTRTRILEGMAACLRPGGVVAVELFMYPGVDAARIPRNHARWAENRPARDTNSGCDVWVTPDQLGDVYQDFRLFFADLQFQEFDLFDDYTPYDPDAIYQYRRNAMLVSGTKGRSLSTKYFGPTRTDW
jgi:SAM-dependent methyltransferase